VRRGSGGGEGRIAAWRSPVESRESGQALLSSRWHRGGGGGGSGGGGGVRRRPGPRRKREKARERERFLRKRERERTAIEYRCRRRRHHRHRSRSRGRCCCHLRVLRYRRAAAVEAVRRRCALGKSPAPKKRSKQPSSSLSRRMSRERNEWRTKKAERARKLT